MLSSTIQLIRRGLCSSYSTFKFILYVISTLGKNGYKSFDINFCKAKLLDLTTILESVEKPLSLQVIVTINSILRQ